LLEKYNKPRLALFEPTHCMLSIEKHESAWCKHINYRKRKNKIIKQQGKEIYTHQILLPWKKQLSRRFIITSSKKLVWFHRKHKTYRGSIHNNLHHFYYLYVNITESMILLQ
jgi:catabolite regulation protein CreA